MDRSTSGEFAASLYAKSLFNVVGGKLKEVDYKAERALWDLVIEANKEQILEFQNRLEVDEIMAQSFIFDEDAQLDSFRALKEIADEI